MKYEMNIGLDVAGIDNTPSERQGRLVKAVEMLLADCAHLCYWTLIGDVTAADEPCLYAEVLCSDMVALGNNLCETLRQDCIAVAFLNDGALIGPRAAAWGEFNPEYFRRPEVV